MNTCDKQGKRLKNLEGTNKYNVIVTQDLKRDRGKFEARWQNKLESMASARITSKCL